MMLDQAGCAADRTQARGAQGRNHHARHTAPVRAQHLLKSLAALIAEEIGWRIAFHCP
jgi:hypothetical protein